MTVSVILFCTISISAFLCLDLTLNFEQRQKQMHQLILFTSLSLQIIDFSLLTSSICTLLWYIKKQAVQTGQSDTFKKEKVQLVTILILFDVSFVFRCLFDVWANNQGIFFESNSNMQLSLALVLYPLFVEIIPIFLILLVHSHNFETLHFTKRSSEPDHNQLNNNFDQLDEQSVMQRARSTLIDIKVSGSQFSRE